MLPTVPMSRSRLHRVLGGPRIATAVTLLSLLPNGLRAQDQGVLVSGIVVGPDGSPMENARLGGRWYFDQDGLRSISRTIWLEGETKAEGKRRDGDIVTDVRGRFSVRVASLRGSVSLTVFSADGFLGFHGRWDADAALDGLTVQLQPVGKVRGAITCQGLGLDRVGANADVHAVPGTSTIGRFDASEGRYAVVLPPGPYELYAYSSATRSVRKRVSVRPGQDVELDIDLPPAGLAMSVGRPAKEWRYDSAHGFADERPTLKALRGKWVYVQFWLGRDSRKVLEFERAWREEHPGEDPPFVSVLLPHRRHTDSNTMETNLDESGRRVTYVGEAPVPFPTLFDPKYRTGKAWGITGYSCRVLIDPEGRVVGEADVAMLRRAVAGKVVTPPPFERLSPAERRMALADPDWLETAPMSRHDSMAFWLGLPLREGHSVQQFARSHLWNPRQRYVGEADRERIVDVSRRLHPPLTVLDEVVSNLRGNEFDARIRSGAIGPVTKEGLSATERGLYDAALLAGDTERRAFRQAVRDRYRIHRDGQNGLFGARFQDLPNSWAAEQAQRKQCARAFAKVCALFVELGTITKGEALAIQAEFADFQRRMDG